VAAATAGFRTRGRLVVSLVAADYDNALNRWDNRATTGAFSNSTNADFAAIPRAGTVNAGAVWPARVVKDGITAVAFTGGRLHTRNSATHVSGASVWGGSDWALEAWYLSDGTEVNGELPLFQWGARSGPTSGACNGAYLSAGSQSGWGAGGFYGPGCDVAYAASNTTSGNRPVINQ